MRSTRTRRLALPAALTFALLCPSLTGCGSGKVEEGGQIDISISKEKTEQQNAAFQDYQKQSRGKPKKPPG